MRTLLDHIEDFLLVHREVSASALGRETVKDKYFVEGLRKGRQPRESTVATVKLWMARYALASAAHEPRRLAARRRVLEMARDMTAPAAGKAAPAAPDHAPSP